MATKKKSKRKAPKSNKTGCEVYAMRGGKRKICWKSGKIVSNTEAPRGAKVTKKAAKKTSKKTSRKRHAKKAC